jgi:two-component system, NarL family, response regulator DevR
MKRIRLLIVDDHELVRLGLHTLISRFPHIEIVGEASTASAALKEAARLSPDVVLLDVRLPDASGFEACRKIRELPGNSRVLILTAFADDEIVFEAIGAGADGYLLKEIDGEGLVKAIEKIAGGQSILDPAVTGQVLGRVKSGVAGPVAKDKLEALSHQERRVLALVAEGKTNKEIAAELGLSDKTIKNYLSKVFEKLQLTRRSQAAVFFAQNATL